MNTGYNKIKYILSLTILLIPFLIVGSAQAEEINLSVAGNGEGSSNEVNTQTGGSTTVTQSNQANITNEVNTNLNTGNNQANNNSGNTNITTGNTTANTTITNENVNTNVANNVGCGVCGQTSATIEVSGNGSDSKNTVNAIFSNSTSITQNNIANITNSVYTNANTGKNTANDNAGNVTIKTGNITSITNIKNQNINISLASPARGENGELVIKILSNGADSKNIINAFYNNDFNYFVNNFANITNKDVQHLNTGENKANDNLGDVLIQTGDIIAIKNITNENVNVSVLTPPPPEGVIPPPAAENPSNPPSNPPQENKGNGGGGVGGSNGSPSGDVLGKALGEILPVTGSYWLYLLTLASLIFFFAGWYLRFRSGQAPGSFIPATA